MHLKAKQSVNEMQAGLHLVKVRDVKYALSLDKQTILTTPKGNPAILVTFQNREGLYFEQIFFIDAGNPSFNELFKCFKLDHLPLPIEKEQALGVKLYIAIRNEIDSAGIGSLSIFKVFPFTEEMPNVLESEFIFKK